jgi:hypothetical protein
LTKITKDTAITKTTLRLPKSLWDKVQIRAIKESMSQQDAAIEAFELWLREKAQ